MMTKETEVKEFKRGTQGPLGSKDSVKGVI